MITQPFVENSIEHGQLNIIDNGNISIDFSEKNNMLYIEIIDNGVGRAESGKKNNSMKEHKSMALDITNRRVEIINKKYKSKFNLKELSFRVNSSWIINLILLVTDLPRCIKSFKKFFSKKV